MSEAVWVALISNGTMLIALVVSRLWSHLEHKETEKKVDEIHRAVNGIDSK